MRSSTSATKPWDGNFLISGCSRNRSLAPAFIASAYCVSNCDSASTWLDRSSAAVCALSPATTIEMSLSGSSPACLASARATITPPDAIEMTPIRLPLRSAIVFAGLSLGTAMP